MCYNTDMDELKKNVAENIAAYRKKLNITQLQLAEMLNYSDKAVSKWERGEAVPDIFILKKLADIFSVTVDELLSSRSEAPISLPEAEKKPLTPGSKLIITLLSAGLVWLVATIVFVALQWGKAGGRTWLAFIYAIPLSAVVLIVFNGIWGGRIRTMLLVSVLIWSVAVAVRVSFDMGDTWLIFIIGIPLQILTVLWTILKKHKDKGAK